VGTFRGRFWRRAVSGRRRSSLRRTNVRLVRTTLPSYPYTKITSRKGVIGKAFGVVIDDIIGVPRGLRPLGEHFFRCGFLRP